MTVMSSGVERRGDTGTLRIGSAAHKQLFCGTLIDSFIRYRPRQIEWPRLDPAELLRLRNLPIWEIALQTEAKAGLRVSAYAEGIDDPLLRQAVMLVGFEEARHKEMLAAMAAAYGIELSEDPVCRKPRDTEWAFMVTGFSECVDSFFAFGLFEAARRSGFFAPALVAAFEAVVQEEARHILFFVNWAAWHRRNLPWWRKPRFVAKIVGVWSFLVWERVQTARDMGRGENFTAGGHRSIGLTLSFAELLALCVRESERRFAAYDDRLLRPRTMPRLARFALRLVATFTPSNPRSLEEG